jgi:hypothetical protein
VIKKLYVLSACLALTACASSNVTQVRELSAEADAPYDNILVVSLFKSFDARRYLEKEIVKQLEANGVSAVASTSLMDTKTPVTRQTFRDMAASLNSDAVLVTQLVSFDTTAKMKDARAQSTYNIRSTYYFNVWSVELTEYVAPPSLQLNHDIVLATQFFSVAREEPVWAIESQTEISLDYDERGDISVMTDEARVIATHLSRDGLLAP